MKIIAGLGNPGKEYEKTRHNIGFQIIDLVREELKFPEFKNKPKFNAEISEGEYNTEKILLVKPMTFMNLSGDSVQKIMNFYHAYPDDLWVIVDDLDFQLGDLKIRAKGGPGTHNGLISVHESINSDKFPRFKVGIESRSAELKGKFAGKDYVLSKFEASEEKIMVKTRKKACEAIIYSLEKGISAAMNKFN